MPGLHPRVADRPEEHRVHLGDPRELLVGEHLARAQEAIRAEVEVHQRHVEVADGVEHLEALGDHLRAGAVAADHPDRVGVRHGVTSLVCPASLAWTCRARFTAAR